MSDTIVKVSDATFEEEVINSELPVLVDYWAEWCGPCKLIEPVLEDIADDYEGKIKVCKVNIEENTDSPARYHVRSIPTLMIFKNGNVEAQRVGSLSKSQIATFIDSNL